MKESRFLRLLYNMGRKTVFLKYPWKKLVCKRLNGSPGFLPNHFFLRITDYLFSTVLPKTVRSVTCKSRIQSKIHGDSWTAVRLHLRSHPKMVWEEHSKTPYIFNSLPLLMKRPILTPCVQFLHFRASLKSDYKEQKIFFFTTKANEMPTLDI